MPAAPWTCPECQRQFGRRNQSHTCAPALDLDAYLEGCTDAQREVFEVVAEHLTTMGPVVVEAVDVGIFFKRRRTFAELRPVRDRFRLSILLSTPVEHPRVRRTVRISGSRVAIFIDLAGAGEVDEQLREWLTEGYLDSPV